MASNKDLGEKGEAMAQSYLVSNGYRILNKNWRSGKCEIDLVTRKGDLVVMVEVKTRSGRSENLDEVLLYSQEKCLREAVGKYMEGLDDDLECRIDLLMIRSKGKSYEIEHLENILDP